MKKLFCVLIFFVFVIDGSIYAQWVQLSGKATHQCLAICATSDALIAATQDSNIVRSTDKGATWVQSSAGILDSIFTNTLWSQGDTVYLGSNKGGYVSVDGGVNWAKIDVGPSSAQSIYTFARRGNYLFTAGDSGVFRSSDNGAHWQATQSGIPCGTSVRAIASGDQYLYVATRHQGIFRSSDNGDHWTLSGTGGPKSLTLTALWTSGPYVIVINESGGWLRSTDHGDTWLVNLGSFVPVGAIGAAFCTLPNPDVVICGAERGIIRSTDNGNKWQAFRIDSISYMHVVALCVSGDYLYAASPEQWIWRRRLSEILPPSSVDASVSPYALRLSQSIPNPAASGAEVSYALPSYTPVTLKLYNAMMQEVSTVVDEPQEAGEHTAALDASALPSGVYYYRLSTGASTLTRRMVVVK